MIFKANFKKVSYLILGVFLLNSCIVDTEKEAVDCIDPIIGANSYGKKTKDTHGFGKTFPGAATPLGLVQLSTDTYSYGDNGSGYS